MKSFIQLWALLLLVGNAMGLKDRICWLMPFFEGFSKTKCTSSITKYSYNSGMNQCMDWIYGGCGANANNFNTIEECEAKCKE